MCCAAHVQIARQLVPLCHKIAKAELGRAQRSYLISGPPRDHRATSSLPLGQRFALSGFGPA